MPQDALPTCWSGVLRMGVLPASRDHGRDRLLIRTRISVHIRESHPHTHPPTRLLQERVFSLFLEIAWWVGGWVGWMIEPSGAQHRLACGATVHRSLRVACDDRSSTSFSLLLLQIGARRRRAAAHRHTGSAACCCSDAAKRSLAARRRRRRSRRSHGDSGRRSARHRRGRSSS